MRTAPSRKRRSAWMFCGSNGAWRFKHLANIKKITGHHRRRMWSRPMSSLRSIPSDSATSFLIVWGCLWKAEEDDVVDCVRPGANSLGSEPLCSRHPWYENAFSCIERYCTQNQKRPHVLGSCHCFCGQREVLTHGTNWCWWFLKLFSWSVWFAETLQITWHSNTQQLFPSFSAEGAPEVSATDFQPKDLLFSSMIPTVLVQMQGLFGRGHCLYSLLAEQQGRKATAGKDIFLQCQTLLWRGQCIVYCGFALSLLEIGINEKETRSSQFKDFNTFHRHLFSGTTLPMYFRVFWEKRVQRSPPPADKTRGPSWMYFASCLLHQRKGKVTSGDFPWGVASMCTSSSATLALVLDWDL